MACRVIWTEEASAQRKAILTYGFKQFGSKVARKLRDTLKKQSLLLSDNPKMGREEPLLESFSLQYRSFVIHKHYKLIYHIDQPNNTVYIVDIWDTRREPDSLVKGI